MTPLAGYVAALVVGVATGLILERLRPREKVQYWLAHEFVFQLTDLNPPLTLHTASVSVQNFGRAESSDVEIVHEQRPDFFKLHPALDYEEDTTPAGEHITRIAGLGPKEYFTIEYLSYTRFPKFLYIRTSSGQAQRIWATQMRVWPKWMRRVAVALMLSGGGFLLYWLIRLGVWVGRTIG